MDYSYKHLGNTDKWVVILKEANNADEKKKRLFNVNNLSLAVK